MESREEAPRDPEPPRLLPKRRWTRRLRKQPSQYYDRSDAWQVWKYSPQTPSGVGTSQPETRQHPQRPLPRIQKGEAHLWRYSPQKHQLREGANHSLEPAHSEWRDDAPQPPGPPHRSHSARNHHLPSHGPQGKRKKWHPLEREKELESFAPNLRSWTIRRGKKARSEVHEQHRHKMQGSQNATRPVANEGWSHDRREQT